HHVIPHSLHSFPTRRSSDLESIRGTLVAFSLNANASPIMLDLVNNTRNAGALQVGNDFALWQGDKGYQMYDLRAGFYVTVPNAINNARLLAINDDTTVWVMADQATTTTTPPNSALPTVRLTAFNWPTK